MSTASPACAARGFSNIAGPARRAGRDRGAERPQLRLRRLADEEPRGALRMHALHDVLPGAEI